MALLICVTGRNNDKLIAKLSELLPKQTILQWPVDDASLLAKVEFVLAWNAPEVLWSQLPNLKVVHSYGAGIDSIPVQLLPPHVEVARIVDPNLADDMAEYVLGHILSHKLGINMYLKQQAQQAWKPCRAKSGRTVGIMGMGQLGLAVADKLNANRFTVKGWSNSVKSLEGIIHFCGDAELGAFLQDLDYLVCLLPLTEQTKGILNAKVFAASPAHCVLINVARGLHLNEADLLTAITQETFGGAVLDVFETEPLPTGHAFWSHPNITVTPHVAALTSLSTAALQIANNYLAMTEGRELMHIVQKKKGY
ncbi:glyoxylate/hydroxypyruvate reductase A [Pseudoalteromonas sp. McH1-7]|uniref:2-hydroxyacid dehydrogenase n=1 Tax=Pseudoalteromonas TaxID=53246 RepID=UPI001590B998|nr:MULTISPECIES: glyoxylate/hydroxypyruvate reductase A [Pseudoalteromonas]MDW7547766.1 glyoxylate/hydroxypyruvate reductase A [Pseudoalteromonas peptidolytica]NUZ11328.1 glyoxylate/hydroxypyruvate reductase A [Pseudoalteromonas sp. McH1-7]